MSFLKKIFLSFTSDAGRTLCGLLTGVILAHSIGAMGRGLMTTVLIWPIMLSYISNLSLSYANVYYGASEPEHRQKLLANTLWLGATLGSIIGIGSAIVLPHIIPLTYSQRFLLMGGLLCIPFSIWMDSGNAILLSASRLNKLGIIKVAGPLATLLIYVALLTFHKMDLITAVVGNWAGGWIQSSLTMLYLAQEKYIGFIPDYQLFKRSLSYGLRTHLGSLAEMANFRLDQLMMTAIVAPKALGLYAFAVTLSEITKQVASAITTVLLPSMAEQKSDMFQRELAIRSVRWSLIVGCGASTALFFTAPFFIKLIWGDQFLDAVPAVRILLPGTVALGTVGPLCASLRGCGKPFAGTIAEVVSLLIMAPLLWILIPRYGIFGAGLASTCGYSINFLANLYFFVAHFGRSSLIALRPTVHEWNDTKDVCTLIGRRLLNQVSILREG